ncbi:hypothetical protein B7463_g8586, partial [Scytalidium lignicola]
MASRQGLQHPRLLVNVIEAKALLIPDETYLLYAENSNWEQDGYKTLTWKQFNNAINKAAIWLDEKFSAADTNNDQIFAYFGPNDMFIPDGRMTHDGTVAILKQLGCKMWITTNDQVDAYKALVSEIPDLELIAVPDLEFFVHSSDIKPYPFSKTWEEIKDGTAWIIHTSGTTGTPKPINITHGYISALDGWNILFERHRPRNITFEHMVGSRTLTAAPPQWVVGVAFNLMTPAFLDMITVLPPANMSHPWEQEKLLNIFHQNKVTGLICPPSLIQNLFEEEIGQQFLKSLKYIMYSGAALDHTVGDVLASHTNLFSAIGSTETGPQLSFESDDPSTWKTFDFVPEMGIHFFQPTFYIFPDATSHPGGDIYSQVNDKHGNERWLSRGRADDLVKLKWLAKFHASHIEETLQKDWRIRSVYVGGQGRDAPFIIMELNNVEPLSADDQNNLLEGIYSETVHDVNQKDTDEIRIPRELVMLADPNLPFPRTIKGTVMRGEVEKAYNARIEAMYERWNIVKTRSK